MGQQPPPPTGVGADPSRGRRTLPLLQVGVTTGLSSLTQLGNGVPKGYLRVLVFDKDSVLVDQQTRQLSTAALQSYEPLQVQLVLPQDGYVTAYVGNESSVDVFFDDVTVEHRQGLQVQENQYDPWGLNLAGAEYSSPGIKGLNQYQFNGKERQGDLGLGWADYGARYYDNQLGRWHSVDPLADQMRRWSPYAFSFNNAIRFQDPDGMEANDVVLTGDRAREAFKQLQASTSLQLTRNAKTGKVSATGKAATESDKQLLAATKDPNKTVLLNAISDNEITVNGRMTILPLGGYAGSYRIGNKLFGEQYVNTDQASIVAGNGGPQASQTVLHELLESYSALRIGNGVHTRGKPDGEATYTKAHNSTNLLPAANVSSLEGNIHKDSNTIPGYSIFFYTNPTTKKDVEIFRVTN